MLNELLKSWQGNNVFLVSALRTLYNYFTACGLHLVTVLICVRPLSLFFFFLIPKPQECTLFFWA